MPARFATPSWQTLDLSGEVGEGWKLYFYISGTSTPKDTYTTNALSVANANPVVADSAGRFGDIWLTGNYKVILKDENDVTIWTADPVDGGDSVTAIGISDLEGYEGSAGICHWLAYRSTSGDGGHGWFCWDASDLSTEVTADSQQGVYVAPTSDATGASGAWVRQIERTTVNAAWWGFHPDSNATTNSAAIQQAAAFLQSTGGRIELGAGDFEITIGTEVTCATSPLRTEFIGHGYETTNLVPTTLTGDSTYLLTFNGDSDAVISPTFERINVRSKVRETEQAFNGIDVRSTNQMRIIDCQALWVEGTAWRLQRVYNGYVDIRTFKCGDATNEIWSLIMVGLEPSKSSNDVVLKGTSEQDYYGWNIENTVNLRTAEQIKLHGGPTCERIARFHNVQGVANVMLTLGALGPSGFTISDDDSADESSYETFTPFAGYGSTRLRLPNLTIFRNYVPQADPSSYDTVAWRSEHAPVHIDVQDIDSTVSASGLITEFNATVGTTGWESTIFRIVGAGTGNVDLSEVQYEWEPTNGRIIDLRTATPLVTLAREGTVHIPDISGEIVTGSGNGEVGLFGGWTVGGDDTAEFSSPTRNALARKRDNTDFGWKVQERLLGLTCQKLGSTNADDVSIGYVFPITDSGKSGGGYNHTKAQIKKLAFMADGIPVAWNGASGWGLEVWHTATLVMTLKISLDTFSSAAEDLYPSAKNGVTYPSSGSGHILIFDQGLVDYSSGPNQGVAFILRQYGSPGALTDVAVTAWFEESIYVAT